MELNITNEYIYHYIEDLNAYIRQYNHVIFDVKACNDAHVILSEQHSDVNNSYEIVIGGWGNTKSVIRTCKQCQPRTSFIGNPLSCDSFKSFWISWENGAIRVGRGHIIGHGEFMKWTDPSSHLVNYVGISTWPGSSTEWKIPTDPLRGLFWLGGTDLYHDGEWQWFPEAEYFGYSNWLSGYPGKFRQHCSLISVYAGFKWITDSCMESRNFVCEIDKHRETVSSILG
ncbi:C3 and PZP-like alpha-2-macroglobulin domain-containing protein 8 [Ostrea edulis]|uniref:C3 and PZP-like alpha-2-macroglobulin domain-containing protein 8 n=1 Tax=Ostrea edulis TaxID=37623 RepID=UPI0024AFBB44|nr:C3 and PZP-like alpha-2-macroglobulin domain-containing protein 8 [Ostrea edulis]